MKKQLAVFASGTGTNFDAIARACADGVLDAEVAVMVCDKPGAAVIEKAARYGVETFVFSPKSYPCKAAFEAEIVKTWMPRRSTWCAWRAICASSGKPS